MRAWCLLVLAACSGPEARARIIPPPSTASDVLSPELTDVHYSGRFTADGRFAWPASGVSARFDGTGIAITLSGGPASFVAWIDGVKGTPFTTTLDPISYTLASGLPSGLHSVEVRRRTDAKVGVTTFGGFTVTGGELVQSSPPERAHRLLVMGDSITVGYGDDGVFGACHFDLDTEDATVAYPMLLADLLDADVQVIAREGTGLYQDYTGSTDDQMPDLFERTLPDDPTSAWDHAAYTPDIIVIDLGTNDQTPGDPGVALEEVYLDFLAHLRTLFPDAQMYLGQGPMGYAAYMGTHMQNVVNRYGDARVHRATIDTIDPADGYGCDSHPNTITHRKMAEQLAAQIASMP